MSKISYKIAVIKYIYERVSKIEDEYNSKISYFRYHKADEVDHLEIIIAKARKDLINEIMQDLNKLLAFTDKR